MGLSALRCDGPGLEPAAGSTARWEPEVVAFAAQDARVPPRRGGIVFVGSSSIRMWDLDPSFPGLGFLNRGFGGSHFSDCAELAPRIVTPYAPQTVVVYAGDNDIAAGKTPAMVLRDARAFAARVHAGLPDARIVFLSIKPSLARWSLWPAMREANRLVEEWVRDDPRLGFVDVATGMLGPDGKPRRELFIEDGLHLSARGYELWSAAVRHALGLPFARAEPRADDPRGLELLEELQGR